MRRGILSSAISGIGGALLFGMAGSGLEDLISNLDLSPRVIESGVDFISVVTGSIGFFIFYANSRFSKQAKPKDMAEELAIADVLDEEPEQAEIEAKPNRRGLGEAVGLATRKLRNREIGKRIYARMAEALDYNPFKDYERQYKKARRRRLVRWAGMFKPFQYKKRTIDPKKTLDMFFEKGNMMYRMAVERVSDEAELAARRALTKKRTYLRADTWQGRFRAVLNEEVRLATDVSLWLAYLSQKGGMVGRDMKKWLTQSGITDIEYLPHDVEVLGNNLLRLYNYAAKPLKP